jgi:hypothetical protein
MMGFPSLTVTQIPPEPWAVWR